MSLLTNGAYNPRCDCNKGKTVNSKKTECVLDSGEEWTFKTQLKLVGVVVARNLIV